MHHRLSFFSLTLSFTALMIFWIIMSGSLQFMHLLFGVFSSVVVIMVNYKLKSHLLFPDDMEDIHDLRFGRTFYYIAWMTLQIIMAGFHVLRVLIRRKMPIEPSIIRFRTNLPNAQAKMILGNSINLTAGTLTLDIDGDLFTVHSLDPQSHEGIINDAMPRQVLKLFSKEERQVVSDVQIITKNK